MLNIIQAYQQSAEATEEKERQKKYEQVIKRWIKLVQGLRIRQRLKLQYGNVPDAVVPASVSEMTPPLFCDYTGFQGPAVMVERHVVQPYHLPRQKYTNVTFRDSGQEEDLPESLPREGSSEKDDGMKMHLDSLQINRDTTPPPVAVKNASSTTRRKTRVPRRSGRRAPGKPRKISGSSSEDEDEPATRRVTRRISSARSPRSQEQDLTRGTRSKAH